MALLHGPARRLEHGSLPWTNAAISGFVLDPDRKKMSKSKGNVVTPIEIFERHSADAVRYWASRASLGFDAAFDEQQIKVGRRLAIKILNASSFALSLEGDEGEVADPLDRSMLRRLAETVAEASDAFEDYEHARDRARRAVLLGVHRRLPRAREEPRVRDARARGRGLGDRLASAGAVGPAAAFAPFLPYVTEEVWSWWQRLGPPRGVALGRRAREALGGRRPDRLRGRGVGARRGSRKAKALAKRSLRTEAMRVVVRDTEERLKVLRGVERDVREAGNVVEIAYEEAAEPSVEVDLAPE